MLQIIPMLFRAVREDYLKPMVRGREGFERTVLKKTQDFLIGLDWTAQDRLDRKKMRMIAHTDAHIVAARTHAHSASTRPRTASHSVRAATMCASV